MILCVAALFTSFSPPHGEDVMEITNLPGMPPVPFKQFSGYVDIGANGKLFYWFVESSRETSEALPVLLLLNGGPPCRKALAS